MKKIFFYSSLLLLCAGVYSALRGTPLRENFSCVSSTEKRCIDYVNPFIGTGGTGHTFPGACVPFGMVQVSPDTKTTGWEHCSGYHADDSTIEGFSHTHLSGTGCGDAGDIMLMPLIKGEYSDLSKPYSGSSFKHENEKSSPGFYSVKFNNGINVELTSTEHTAFHRYTFPQNLTPQILIDLQHGISNDANGATFSKFENNSETIYGYRFSKGWAKNEKLFFAIQFDSWMGWKNLYQKSFSGKINTDPKSLMKDSVQWMKMCLVPVAGSQTSLKIKVALSSVSEENALLNLQTEIAGWDFDAVKKQAEDKWEKNLEKIKVSGGTDDEKTNFYTALYHCMIHPSLWNDVNGEYRGMDDKIHTCEKGHNMYHIFSLWDTYRALHPLMTIIDPQRDNDFVRSLLAKYDESGKLPVWELFSNETDCMIGYHAVPVIVDAYMKGIRDFDTTKALNAMIHSAMQMERNSDIYRAKGYIPADKGNESVSKTLEYAYDDWCIATMAKKMGKDSVANEFFLRAQHYENLWDPNTKFFRAKKMGKFVTPFNPYEVNSNYTEANAWQYLFAVQHDIGGLKNLMGGDSAFATKLDSLFTTKSNLEGRDQPDISGMVGQYAHGNEPSHHFAYLYNYCGQQWKTSETVRKIMKDFYKPTRDGLCGNDDCGQMSAWYVFSAMGFYPVCPGTNEYAIGSPLFDTIKIDVGNGRPFIINVENNSDLNIFPLSLYRPGFDGISKYSSCIFHEALKTGGSFITISLTSNPHNSFGVSNSVQPISEIKNHNLIPVPYFEYDANAFYDSIKIRVKTIIPDLAPVVYYSNGKENYSDSAITIYRSDTLIAITSPIPFVESKYEIVSFTKIPFHKSITYKSNYKPQYSAGGNLGLLDYVHGEETSFAAWQGFEGEDFEAVVKLDSVRTIHRINTDWLTDQNSWIFWPTKVTYEVSTDSIHWTKTDDIDQAFTNNDTVSIWYDESQFPNGIQLKYLRVKATSIKTCPPWHRGAGNDAWIFLDEIEIE